MDIFTLVGKMTIDGIDKSEKQLGGLQNKVQGMSKGLRIAGAAMTAVGGIITGVAIKGVIAYARMGDEVHKMSLRTGFATETLSRLKYAAGLGGASLATVEKAAKRMAATIYDAGEGLSTAVDAMDNLGISVEDFEGLNPEEQFMKFAGAIASVEDASERSALAQRIFGRAGTEMLPMLSEGTEGLKAMMAEAEKFGPIFGQEAAEAAAKLTDTMSQLKGSMDKVKLAIAEKLVPIITPLLEKLRDMISRIGDWMKRNPELARTITIVSVAMGGLLLVLGPIVIMLPQLVGGIIMLKGAMIGLSAAMGPVGWAITGISLALAILIPKILSAKSETEDLTGAMSDLERQTFRLNMQQEYTGDKWDEIKEKGYLTEQEFRKLAEAMDITTEALYDQLEAAKMVEGGLDWITDGVKVHYHALRVEGNILLKNLEDTKIGLEEVAETSELTTDEMLRNVEDLTYKVKIAAEKRTRVEIDAINDQMRVAQIAHQDTMSRLSDEYNATMAIIDARVSATVAGYQSQIEAIDNQMRAIDDAQRMREYAEQKLELEAEIAAEDNAERRVDLEQRLNELLLRSGNEEWQGERELALQSRIAEEGDAKARQALEEGLAEFLIEVQAQRSKEELLIAKDALREQIDIARRQATDAKARAKETYDYGRRIQEQRLDDILGNLEDEKTVLDTALEEQLERYDNDLEGFQGLLEQELVDLDAFVVDYNKLMDQLEDKTVTITTVQQMVGGRAPTGAAGVSAAEFREAGIAAGAGEAWYGAAMQGGGVAMSEMLARIGEQAPGVPEAVLPLKREMFERLGLIGGGPTINIDIHDNQIADDVDIDNLGEKLVARMRGRGVKL